LPIYQAYFRCQNDLVGWFLKFFEDCRKDYAG